MKMDLPGSIGREREWDLGRPSRFHLYPRKAVISVARAVALRCCRARRSERGPSTYLIREKRGADNRRATGAR